MSWYLIIPLQILGIYLCNRIIFKFLEIPYEKERYDFDKTWHDEYSVKKSKYSYRNDMNYEEEKFVRENETIYNEIKQKFSSKESYISTLHWFFNITLIIFPIIIFGLWGSDDYEGWIGMLLVPWFGSFIYTVCAIADNSKFFNLLLHIFWYLCIFSLLLFWLYAIGLELTIFEDYLGENLGLMYLVLTLFISLFTFPFWLFDKINQIKGLDKLKIVEKNTISYIIIAIIYLPIIVKMFDSYIS